MNSSIFQFALLLLLSHLAGDYLLQTAWLARNKRKSFWVLLLHVLIYSAATYVLVGVWTAWQIPLVVFGSHLLIDWLRGRLRKDRLVFFLLDQGLHLTVLGLLLGLVLLPMGEPSFWFKVAPAAAGALAVYASALLLLTLAGGFLIGFLVKPLQDQIKLHYQKNGKPVVEGLANGGKIIGWLERLLIFAFVMTGQYAGIGFLVAAKSVFRFGELKESENRKEAEYIIIGTFASFLYAIAVSLAAKWVLGVLK